MHDEVRWVSITPIRGVPSRKLGVVNQPGRNRLLIIGSSDVTRQVAAYVLSRPLLALFTYWLNPTFWHRLRHPDFGKHGRWVIMGRSDCLPVLCFIAVSNFSTTRPSANQSERSWAGKFMSERGFASNELQANPVRQLECVSVENKYRR